METADMGTFDNRWQHDKITKLEAELVFVRSQFDKVRAAGQLAEDHLNDEDYDRQYALEELLLSLSEICSMPLPTELAQVSPALANLLKEGRVS
jgi:hypothetical protein